METNLLKHYSEIQSIDDTKKKSLKNINKKSLIPNSLTISTNILAHDFNQANYIYNASEELSPKKKSSIIDHDNIKNAKKSFESKLSQVIKQNVKRMVYYYIIFSLFNNMI